MKKNKLVLAAGILAEMLAESAKGEGTYQPDPKFKAVTVENWEPEVIPTRYGEMRKARFEVEGQAKPFSFKIKGNRELDADSPIRVQRFIAQEDFALSNGGTLKKGAVAYFATQA